MPAIRPIELIEPGLDELRAQARQEGFRFIERLYADWQSGANRFSAPGEALYGCVEDGVLIAVGGLNRNPFAAASNTGRIRRVYVRPAWRNKGIGEALMRSLIENAQRAGFTSLHLRTDNPAAARFYERLGFARSMAADATHVRNLVDN